jgi:uncharacterized GH25 family protein
MKNLNDEFDEETLRSFSRMMYGHELWLEKVEVEGKEISVFGYYGHKLNPDKPMPTDYANPVLYDDNGRAETPEREIVRGPAGWRFTFPDKGADVYTFYVDSNSVWVTNKEGWHRGTKRDWEGVNYSGASNMVAKRIISRDGTSPGSVMHAALEIMPGKAKYKTGEAASMDILYEGKPLKGNKCIVYNRRWQDLRTIPADDNGVLRFVMDEPGIYIIVTKHTDPNKSVADEFDETVFDTSLTIEAE